MIVIWQPMALDRLADYYVGLSLHEQRSLELVIRRIDARLADNPWNLGESRTNSNRRVWFVGPFALTLDLPPGKCVYVIALRVLRHVADEP